MTKWQIGSIVRVKRPSPQKGFGKAMIAIMDGGAEANLLWESIAPQPLFSDGGSHSSAGTKNFLVAPRISENNQNPRSIDDSEYENESTVPLNELLPLMDFESNPEISKDVDVLKQQGDSLLRAGDASTAVCYYEAALQQSCQTVTTSVGSSIILKTKGGYLKIAEIDCVEEIDGLRGSFSLDVTFVESGEETEVQNSAVVLGILDKDLEERLQERILLNLSRCLHQLADIDEPKHRPAYLKGAILACSLAIILAEFHASNNGDDTEATTKSTRTLQSALHLRAQAYILLSIWPHAKQDAKRLIKVGKQDQGKSMLDNIERRKQVQVKKDKKLAKAVAKLVHNSTSSNPPDGENREQQADGRSGSLGVSAKKEVSDKIGRAGSGERSNNVSFTKTSSNNQQPLTSFLFTIAIVGVVVSFLVQRATNGGRTGGVQGEE